MQVLLLNHFEKDFYENHKVGLSKKEVSRPFNLTSY